MLDSFGLEVLRRDECLSLLAATELGRVVFTHRGLPAIQPVRFTLRGQAIVFGTPADSALGTVADDSVVAFEADVFAADLSSGWYVAVLGRASRLPEDEVTALPPLTWTPREGDRLMRIPAEVVTGRRLDRRRAVSAAPDPA